MNPREPIKAKFTHITNIIECPTNLEKYFNRAELVWEIFHNLAKENDLLVITIKATKNVILLSLDEMLGDLMTNELEIAWRNRVRIIKS